MVLARTGGTGTVTERRGSTGWGCHSRRAWEELTGKKRDIPRGRPGGFEPRTTEGHDSAFPVADRGDGEAVWPHDRGQVCLVHELPLLAGDAVRWHAAARNE